LRSEERSVLLPFILSWNLRNVVEHMSSVVPESFCITGTDVGEYPIDGWKPLFIEIPVNARKRDIAGRSYHAFGVSLRNTEWDRKRIVILPIYAHSQCADIEKLKIVIRHWIDVFSQDDIPCLALAVKCQGRYSEDRRAQSVSALVIWSDAVSRIISLDWAEGSLEDCVTPEWYIETSPLLNLTAAVEKIQELYENISWEETSFSIHAIPSCLCFDLCGEKVDASNALWQHEWRYVEYAELKDDLNRVLSDIQEIFNIEPDI
jgi:hypothetical protein